MRGVKYIGPYTNMSGYGEAARNNILSLHKAGVPITIESRSFEMSPPPVGSEEDRKVLAFLEGREIDYDIVICHMTPDLAPSYLKTNEGKYFISYSAWETSHIHPLWTEACNQVSEMWVPSQWNVEAFKNSGVKVPVYKMPHGISPDFYEGVDTSSFALTNLNKDETFVFYSVFQWNARKNPDGLLRAYFNAFGPDDNVVLLLKTYLGVGLPKEAETQKLRQAVLKIKSDMNLPYFPKVRLITEHLSSDQMKALHLYGDAFVLLTRGEGWGIPFMEAGLAGNPVIGTGMGGNTEFMKQENSFLLCHNWTYVSGMSSFNQWYLGNQQWAEPNLIDASEKMRFVYKNQQQAKDKGFLLWKNIQENYNWDKIAEKMIARLKEL